MLLVYWPSDIGRIQRGPRTDLSWEQLEILVREITGEAFIPETLIPPGHFAALRQSRVEVDGAGLTADP